MKICELCKGVARMYCESDQANLCWSCDSKVHSANFLVERHSRRLLCHVCQSPTAWSASGSRLGSMVSTCERCFGSGARSGHEAEVSRQENRAEDEFEDEDEDEDDDEVEEEDDDDEIDSEDIQVVPWSSTPPPPPASSSSDDSLLTEREVSGKRLRENDTDLQYEDNRRNLSSQLSLRTPSESSAAFRGLHVLNDETCMLDSGRPAKLRRTTDPIGTGRVERSESRSSLIVDAKGRFHREEVQSSRDLAEFCRLSDDPTALDLDCSETS
ncbi:zinc finger protein CONSTANS-LIKE 4-like [Ipomoea triloba]|uniref:zinc finger protein CONSTANS-LIKE 4-like n=1 Tax=Ipomoea triloba TaxID=35885 RepID=UPI00125E6ACE|nr:zinc finger protein CONSTANS-LIKE 4-like [Ipomoea triloba]